MKNYGKYFLLILFIIVINSTTNESKTIRSIKFQTCTCTARDWNFIKILDFKLIKFKSQNALNGSLVLWNDLHAFELDWTLSVPKANGKNWNLFNISVDGCVFLKAAASKSRSLTNNIMEQLDQSAENSIPKKCPVEKHKEIHIKNFVMNAKIIPAFIPDVDFKTTLTFKRNNIEFWAISLTGFLETKFVKGGERN